MGLFGIPDQQERELMRNHPAVQSAVNTFRLLMPTVPSTGRAGNLLGRGVGSSLEFQEFREYTPGDDVRHLDWSAYARTDELMLRMYREEISPQLEILLDASRSMTTSPAKSAVARQLAAALLLWSSQLGGGGRIAILDDAELPLRITATELDRLQSVPFAGCRPITESLQRGKLAMRRQSIRIVISDFLFDADPEPVIRSCADGAGAVWVLQWLSGWEAAPAFAGGRRLMDVETGAESDVVLTPATVAEYKKRLSALQDELHTICRRHNSRFLVATADEGLHQICRNTLCPAGLIAPV